ncbi:MAG: PDZ domain-containing protein [Xanthobacteraceae bacterium]
MAPSDKVSGSGNEGVVVTGVNADGIAAEHGFQVGDVILEVGGKTVSTPAEVRKSLADARSEGKHTVLLRRATARNSSRYRSATL